MEVPGREFRAESQGKQERAVKSLKQRKENKVPSGTRLEVKRAGWDVAVVDQMSHR